MLKVTNIDVEVTSGVLWHTPGLNTEWQVCLLMYVFNIQAIEIDPSNEKYKADLQALDEDPLKVLYYR